MDPYKVLGLKKNASTREIKDSYRKLALEKHPDKTGGSASEFQTISEAYEILSDPQKKSKFDMGGNKVNFGNLRNMHNMNMSNIFGSGYGNLFNMQQEVYKPQVSRTPDKKQEVKLSLEDMYNGKTTKFAITRSVKCTSCDGIGGEGKFTKPCISCAGRGFRNAYSGGGVKTLPCMQCDSQGNTSAFTKACKKCSSRGYVKERIIVEAVFPKGCPNGYKIKKEGMSDYKTGKVTGDIIIIAKQKEHSFFTRCGKNLKCKLELTFCESVCGFKKHIKHLDNREIEISRQEITLSNDKMNIPGEGMFKDFGFLEVEFIILPHGELSEKSREEIRKLLS